MPQSYIKRILDARIYDLAEETPLDHAPLLSIRTGNNVLIKREDLQPVFSFKVRGAYNKLLKLGSAERARGVIAASAGNHAQGLALAALKAGIQATIVMPKTAPQIKIDAVRNYEANVILTGDSFEEAHRHSRQLMEQHQLTYIHPYDDVDVIAGQGTVGMEILRQHPKHIDAIFVPVGGGGLCAGVAAYVKYVRSDIRVFAVEAEDSACLELAIKHGSRNVLPHVGLFADGVAVAQIGEEPFRVIKETIDGVITATTDEICAAIKDIFEDTRSIAEPSGALALAGLKKYVAQHNCQHQTLIAIDSGANINFDRLRYISERTEIGEKREAILAVTLPEKPGAYKSFCAALGNRNITEFNYRYGDSQDAHVFVGVQVSPDHNDRLQLVSELQNKGYAVVDMTDNEMAKLHIRHMVGGQSPTIGNERVYRFEFPERPGALFNFLNLLAGRWNISMFHYRNHGAAYGRVLVGLQFSTEEQSQVLAFLDELSFPYWDETDNVAYRFFLASQDKTNKRQEK